MINTNVPLNKKGQNELIKLKKIDEDKLKKFGFTNYVKPNWYYCEVVYDKYPVSFNITINKVESTVKIEVLDDNFCQHYNYQKSIIDGKTGVVIDIHKNVQAIMEKLMDSEIIEGYVLGDYI